MQISAASILQALQPDTVVQAELKPGEQLEAILDRIVLQELFLKTSKGEFRLPQAGMSAKLGELFQLEILSNDSQPVVRLTSKSDPVVEQFIKDATQAAPQIVKTIPQPKDLSGNAIARPVEQLLNQEVARSSTPSVPLTPLTRDSLLQLWEQPVAAPVVTLRSVMRHMLTRSDSVTDLPKPVSAGVASKAEPVILNQRLPEIPKLPSSQNLWSVEQAALPPIEESITNAEHTTQSLGLVQRFYQNQVSLLYKGVDQNLDEDREVLALLKTLFSKTPETEPEKELHSLIKRAMATLTNQGDSNSPVVKNPRQEAFDRLEKHLERLLSREREPILSESVTSEKLAAFSATKETREAYAKVTGEPLTMIVPLQQPGKDPYAQIQVRKDKNSQTASPTKRGRIISVDLELPILGVVHGDLNLDLKNGLVQLQVVSQEVADRIWQNQDELQGGLEQVLQRPVQLSVVVI